jgi:hypothetical protein
MNRETINDEGAMKLQQVWSLCVGVPDVGIRSDGWHPFVPRLPHIVLRGADRATEKAIGALMPTLFKPIHLWCGGMPLSLPPTRRGTLILLGLALAKLDRDRSEEAFAMAPDNIDGPWYGMLLVRDDVSAVVPHFAEGTVSRSEDLYDRLKVILKSTCGDDDRNRIHSPQLRARRLLRCQAWRHCACRRRVSQPHQRSRIQPFR